MEEEEGMAAAAGGGTIRGEVGVEEAHHGTYFVFRGQNDICDVMKQNMSD